MSISSFFFKQLLKSKMKDVPASEQEKIISIIDKNPDLFEKIAIKAQEKMKSGKDQMSAINETVSEYNDELRKVLEDVTHP